MINDQAYKDRLLALCTPSQKDLFARMYPTGVTNDQLAHAIKQIENTLCSLNCKNEEFNDLKISHHNDVVRLESAHAEVVVELRNAQKHITSLEAVNDRLSSNPDAVENNKTQERLLKLDALEAGGVDNWDSYDDAMESYREQIL